MQRPRLRRPSSLEGLTSGCSHFKERGDVFLDHVEVLLKARGLECAGTGSAIFHPAPFDLQQQIQADCHVVVEALAD